MLTFVVWRAIVMASAAAGVTILPTNSTVSDDDSSDVDIALPLGNTIEVFSTLQPLTAGAQELPTYGISDTLFHATGNNQQNLTENELAYMSCDSGNYPGYYSLVDVFQTALGVNATAIILYSLTSQSCNISGLDSDFQYIYSMPNQTVAQNLLNRINGNSDLSATVLHSDSSRINHNGSDSTGGSTTTTHSSYGSSPTTAVAMIILYSVTGIITALFLIIIITGAVRAHRHPERYGPRNIMGRPRQSRARGLARAMLDTIPIVKFGEPKPEDPKSTDVEMAETIESSNQNEQHLGVQGGESMPRQSTTSARSGIGAAASGVDGTHEATTTQTDEALGCSICTDDFVAGQDLRVLPCNHQFHPECIDPWLLNVSGTCPLCRIDLRPQGESQAETADGELPPPIVGGTGPYRISMRRSLLIGLGLDRGLNTEEQRVAAARGLRGQQTEGQGQGTQTVDEGRRRRLRERLGIRTRRRGQEAVVTAEEPTEATETSPMAERNSMEGVEHPDTQARSS